MQFSFAFSRGEDPMKEPVVIRTVRSVITLCFAVCYIINVFLHAPLLDDMNIALMVVVLVMSIFVSTGSSRLIGIILIAIASGCCCMPRHQSKSGCVRFARTPISSSCSS